MNDTTQLKALRDAWLCEMPTPTLEAALDRAIAAIEAAEQPKPCAGFVCGGYYDGPGNLVPDPGHFTHTAKLGFSECICARCGQPYSALCHQQPSAEHDDQPAPVPPPDSVPREQHEAALAQARREGLREALELVERDAKRVGSTWYDCRQILTIAADGIRALAEKGGEGEK